MQLSGHQEKYQAAQNAYFPPKSRYCYIIIFLVLSTTWTEDTMHPKVDPAGVWTHDLLIMTVDFCSNHLAISDLLHKACTS